jgi:integrase
MRAGELAGLQWADIDLEHRVITVQRSYEGPTKSAKIRRIPILDTLLVILRQWRIQTQTIWVFPNQKGTHHQPSAQIFQEIFQKILAQAGFKKILVKGKQRHYLRFHDLRHTFASQWMMSGGDLFKLQRILGHQSIAMTQRYSHLSPSAFESDYSRLGTPMPCLAPVLSIHSNGQVHSSVNESAPLSLHPIQEVESL